MFAQGVALLYDEKYARRMAINSLKGDCRNLTSHNESKWIGNGKDLNLYMFPDTDW